MIIGYVSKEALALLFLFFGLTIAVIIKQLQKKFNFVPYTPTLFMVSVALGYFAPNLGVIGQSITAVSEINPMGILLIFLPPLIFEGAFNSDWYIFRKQAVQIFILAFPSVIVSAFLIMFSLKVIINFDDSFFSYPEAFMFGSVLSCTDTVAVLALLKQAGAPKKFNSLIEGESLFNDGTCMVLLTISLQLVKGGNMQPLQIMVSFVELTVGAIILGSIFGYISTLLIKVVNKDSILTINITVAMCYLLYFVSQFVYLGIRISGIVALVSMGLYMAAFAKTKFTSDAKEKAHEFWKVFVFIAETIIFILGGVVVGIKALGNHQLVSLIGYDEIVKLLILYVCMTFARFLSISVFMPILKKQGYGLKWIQVLALVYGGLRGAIGIAFVLILAADEGVRLKTKIICLFLMAGCAFLTLLINGPTCGIFIIKIGLCKKSQVKVKLFKKFVKECVSDLQRKVEELQHSEQMSKSNWQEVKVNSGIEQLKEIVGQLANARQSMELTQRKESMQANLLTDARSDDIDPSLMRQIRSRYLIALKGIFWQKFENNQCSGLSVRNLIECVDLDLDNVDVPLNSWEYLVGHLHNPWFFPICFWLKKFPIIKHFAFSLIYDRVMVIYDIVSTYLEGLADCEQVCTMFPFQREVIYAVINESKANRKLAQSYLEKQIKIAYPEIMKRIQTAKAAHSLITYQKQFIQQSHHKGQIDEQFYKQLTAELQKMSANIENDSGVKEELSSSQILMLNDFFMQMSKDMRKEVSRQKIEMVFQKDQPIIKQYEKQKYIYLVTRGQICEEWKQNRNVIYKKSTKLYELAGFSALWSHGDRREIEYTCTADSIVCVYCFPIETIREVIIKNPKFQTIIYKEMLPILLKVHPNLKLSLTAQRWSELKPFVTYRKVQKQQEIEIIGQYIVLVEGSLETDQTTYEPGYYDMTTKKAKIKGPAKVFYCNTSFEEDHRDSKTIGEYMMRKDRFSKNVRMSSQKRNTMTGAGGGAEVSGALTRMLFTRDE